MGELAAAIAHELCQPLATIMSNAQAAQCLMDSINPPLAELREIISDIFRADKYAGDVINRIRDFTSKSKGRIQPLDLNSVVADALHLIAGEARRRAVRVRTELAQRLPIVSGDRTQLQQVLVNLAINGMQAMANTPRSSCCLTVRTQSGPDGQVELAVEDCGGGITPDHLPHLFETFFTTQEEGMGLGLSIARSIVESHHGRMWAENNSSRGATFHIALPAAPDRSAAVA